MCVYATAVGPNWLEADIGEALKVERPLPDYTPRIRAAVRKDSVVA
jgi:hypothetical protein